MARGGRRRGEAPIPPHPYRGSAILYAGMAVFLVLAAALTGADTPRALAAAAAFFVVATAWSWWRFSVRIRERDAREQTDANGGDGRGEGRS